jgi:hypothetical protein
VQPHSAYYFQRARKLTSENTNKANFGEFFFHALR